MSDAASEGLPLDETTTIRREAHRQVRDRRVLDAVLDDALVAHVAVVRDGLPLVLPFACARDGDSLLLHGSTASGLMRLASGQPVCVAVTHVDGLVFARTTFESSMHYRAAVVHGTAVALSGAEKERALVVLSDHLFPGRSAEVRVSSARELAATLVLRVPLTQASVKVSDGPPESEDEPDSVWAGVLPLALTASEPVPAEYVPAAVPVPPSVRRAARRAGPRADWAG
jgi:nitroimidazol reductase NimA-like FMN-containing flavoprotein (pyridoxamine 5'-phosphate oxidase superfamily)